MTWTYYQSYDLTGAETHYIITDIKEIVGKEFSVAAIYADSTQVSDDILVLENG